MYRCQPLPASIVKAPDGEFTVIALPDVPSVTVNVPKSITEDVIVRVLLDPPVVNDVLAPKFNVLLPAVLSNAFDPVANEPVPDIDRLAPAVVSVSFTVNAVPDAIVPLLIIDNAPLVDSIVNCSSAAIGGKSAVIC